MEQGMVDTRRVQITARQHELIGEIDRLRELSDEAFERGDTAAVEAFLTEIRRLCAEVDRLGAEAWKDAVRDTEG